MSLSAAEKVRVVKALDRLGVDFIEAGFPSSNPKEAELSRCSPTSSSSRRSSARSG